jgi:VanZ family protein
VIPRRWRPPLLWAAAILVATSIPGQELAAVGAFSFPGADKLVHAFFYGVLGWLSARAAGLPASGRRTAAFVLLGILLFAALDEWHQAFIPGRATDPLDWIADALGATCGMAALGARRRIEAT